MHKPTLRVINILNFVSMNNGCRFSDIVDSVEIPKSTLSPIIKTLVDNMFLICNDGKYYIGKNIFKIGSKYLDNFNAIDTIKLHMKSIVEDCNEICQLGILDGTDILYIEKIDPEQPISLVSSVGKSLPSYSTALGKAILTKFSDAELRNLFSKELVKHTENTISNIDDLINEIHNTKKRSYSIEIEETTKDVICFAVPLKENNDIIASISVSIPTYRSDTKKNNKIIETLLRNKIQIENDLSSRNIWFF